MSDDAPDPLDFRYPAIEPHADGFLDVDDGRRIWWEVSGSPSVRPVALLRGGGAHPVGRRYAAFSTPTPIALRHCTNEAEPRRVFGGGGEGSDSCGAATLPQRAAAQS